MRSWLPTASPCHSAICTLAPHFRLSCSSSNPAINPLVAADTSNLMPFWVVGNDDGFWPALSAPMTVLQMGPAERYDVVIDFSRTQQQCRDVLCTRHWLGFNASCILQPLPQMHPTPNTCLQPLLQLHMAPTI